MDTWTKTCSPIPGALTWTPTHFASPSFRPSPNFGSLALGCWLSAHHRSPVWRCAPSGWPAERTGEPDPLRSGKEKKVRRSLGKKWIGQKDPWIKLRIRFFLGVRRFSRKTRDLQRNCQHPSLASCGTHFGLDRRLPPISGSTHFSRG